jgi:hypothetical protein
VTCFSMTLKWNVGWSLVVTSLVEISFAYLSWFAISNLCDVPRSFRTVYPNRTKINTRKIEIKYAWCKVNTARKKNNPDCVFLINHKRNVIRWAKIEKWNTQLILINLFRSGIMAIWLYDTRNLHIFQTFIVINAKQHLTFVWLLLIIFVWGLFLKVKRSEFSFTTSESH